MSSWPCRGTGNGTFTPMLVPKEARRLDGLDAMIVSLYAGGMTIRDIGHHLAATIGTELSHETISEDHRRRSVTRSWPGSSALSTPLGFQRSLRIRLSWCAVSIVA